MTPDRNEPDQNDETEFGVLAEAGRIDTAGIGIIGGHTAHVDVSLPQVVDDDFDDGDVVDDEEQASAPVIEYDAVVEDDVAEDADASDVPADVVLHEDELDVAVPAQAAHEHAAHEDAVDVDAVDVSAAHEEALGSSNEPSRAWPEPVHEPERPAAAAPQPRPLSEVPADVPPAAAAAAATRADIHAVERVVTRHDLTLASKRLGELGEADRETPDLLTADRLLDPHQVVRPEPEGAWRQFLYSISGHRINLGDGKRARARKALDRRIAAPLNGEAKFVAVVSRKGGVGKTTVTALLGMALADAREDRIIAVDANPDRGTLAERIARSSGKTVRDLARAHASVSGYNDISTIVARDETRLDVIASDSDPRVSEAFNDDDYREVAAIAAHYYSIVLTDTGTGIVHSVMGATLDLSDQLVVVAGLSVDEARLASETLTWLETNGHAQQVRNAVVVLNQARPGTPLVRADELEAHFRTRVRDVVRMPYDPLIAAGSAISYRELRAPTREAARLLAAKVVEGLRALAPAA